uniref:MFS transporter n=1 Tax=Mycena chlorophos TaxID=658473 RepID=A0ABQ0M4T5_MYCCL|nr:MFS transporter [Mycena chlorophos]
MDADLEATRTLDRQVSRDDATLDVPEDMEKGLQSPGTTKLLRPSPKMPATLAPDDPENPRNWGVPKKIVVNAILCIWVLTLSYSSTAYVASIPALHKKFHASQEVSVLGVTLNVFGFAAGPLLMAPLSEIYGRQIVYRVAGLGYSAFAFGAAFAPNIAGLLVMRFFDGFFGSASINNVPASVGDFTTLTERLMYSSLYAAMAFGGPSIGPLVSTFIETYAGYQWNLRVIAIFSTFLSLLVAFVPETSGPILLRRKLKREGTEVAEPSVSELISTMKTAISRPLVYLFTEPVVMLVSIYLSVLYGILYGFFEAFTVVWVDTRGFSQTSFGLTYISLALGFLIGILLIITIGQRMYVSRARSDMAKGIPVRPEARLVLGYYGAILCPIALFIFAWTAPFTWIHWVVPCLGELLFSLSMLLIFTSFIPFLIDCYQLTAASALAAGMTSRALVGGAFPLFSIQMYENLTVQGATSLLAGISCLCAPIPFIFRAYGDQLRARSRIGASGHGPGATVHFASTHNHVALPNSRDECKSRPSSVRIDSEAAGRRHSFLSVDVSHALVPSRTLPLAMLLPLPLLLLPLLALIKGSELGTPQNTNSTSLLVNAIVSANNISFAECWEIVPGYQISTVGGTVGDQVLQLGNMTTAVIIVIPSDDGPNNGGLHNGAHSQWVFALTGGATVTFPEHSGGFSIPAGGVFISTDILGTSTLGHQTIWDAGTKFIQAPFANGAVISHTVVESHRCAGNFNEH